MITIIIIIIIIITIMNTAACKAANEKTLHIIYRSTLT